MACSRCSAERFAVLPLYVSNLISCSFSAPLANVDHDAQIPDTVARRRIWTEMRTMGMMKVRLALLLKVTCAEWMGFIVIYPVDHKTAGHIVDDVRPVAFILLVGTPMLMT